MGMLEGNRPPQLASGAEAGPELKQRRIMLAALALLLVALILVLVKDRRFWFRGSESEDASAVSVDQPDDANPQDGSLTYNAKSGTPASPRPKAKPRVSVPPPAVPTIQDATAPVVNRAALPPLDVEVVAGDQRRAVKTSNPSVKVDMQSGSLPSSAAAVPVQTPSAAVAANHGVSSASERVQLSANAQQVVTHSVEPAYPTLAKQMKVQGSVVLQALIGKEGTIQNLEVLSGPQILSSAAREAVMQWRFKPYYQSGQAIETEAKITVNFTISTY
jgi:protein TonB